MRLKFSTLKRFPVWITALCLVKLTVELTKGHWYKSYAYDNKSNAKTLHQIDSAATASFVHQTGRVTNEQSSESMTHYVKRFAISKTFKICTHEQRPNASTVIWRKGVYQHHKWTVPPYGDHDTFVLHHYFDDRFFKTHKQRFLRAPVAIKGPGPLRSAQKDPETLKWALTMNKVPFYAVLWYDGFEHGVSSICKHSGASGLVRNVNNTYYFQQMMFCPIPEIDLLPSHVSLSSAHCKQAQTYDVIVYPRTPRFPGSRDIGVCMASLYGSMNRTNIPYFVNWMEALKLFGVIEVTMNNASFEFADAETAKTFQYYIDRHELIFTHYPVVHESWERSRKHDDDASESVNKLTTGDCFYRNLKRYWYTLILDVDELPVPLKHNTYKELLEEHLKHYPNLSDAHCLPMQSAFFYRDYPAGNTTYKEHLPILRYTRHIRPEPVEGSHDGVGISKSFHNPRNCVASGHHLCRASHLLGDKHMKRQWLPVDDILIHHYRAFCKYKDDCKKFAKTILHDDSLPKRFGGAIQQRVEKVLAELNFDFNH